ncbi:hypothetical protein FE257_012815 [Aspergillus nanangensis]|uniref:L-serine ammonia-lyase n=1 Tax=Aspergillus nanangensis TaxID=2582783 RepID=A0AAD4CFU6_ASPNN|nr:hypothetical protein FE257_012815 [Aspergillus nanangensis]
MGDAALPRQPWIETPLVESATLSKIAGCRIFLKLELLQPSGSFKSRGIGNFIRTASLDPENRDKDLHFYNSSAGNAGLAAVIAARDLGYPCSIVVPHTTKPMMKRKLQAAGAAAVIQQGNSWAEADSYLRETFINNQEATKNKNIYVPPFDHLAVWDGAATMVPEIEAQLPPRNSETSAFPADVIICSVGGGGLFNGIIKGLDASLSHKRTPKAKDVHVLAVETKGTDSLAHSLRAGRLETLAAITSQATSLGARRVSSQTLKYAQAPPTGIKVVSVVGSDAEAARGVVTTADELRFEVELACGISMDIATGERLKQAVQGLSPDSRVVVIVCGGSNITAEMIAEYRQQLHDGWE